MFIEIEHTLSLNYNAYIRESFLELRMQPKTTADQTLQSFVLAVGPPTKISRYRDWNGNVVHHFTIVHFHDRIEVVARSAVSTHPATPPLDRVTDPRPFPEPPYPLLDFLAFDGPVRPSPAMRKFSQAAAATPGATLGEQVRACGRHIREHFSYKKNVTRYDSTTEDFLSLGAGVCQDFTHLMLGLLRLRQIPCRYVSGYLHVAAGEGEAAQSHAWVEFYSPAAGWVPFDPTHNREVDERYVVVGHGRHYDDVPPNKGIYRGNADETLRTAVRTQESTPKDISALHEEMEQIDVPVYQEIPERRRDRLKQAAEEIAAQDQQEQ
ncbi:MAG TPA: transglutaminase family protein [Candidatus Nitrosotalea sp.]|nr:transglutaminase family protein [Candidatus Nitrosotalea sp.]